MLNPCRSGLVDDPLAGPFSTHRDALGLCLSPVRRRVADPHRHHAYVSADPTVNVAGTELPHARSWSTRAPSVEAVVDAVSAVSRVPTEVLQEPGRERTLLTQAASSLTSLGPSELAHHLGIHRTTAHRARARSKPQELRLVERVLHDPRFAALPGGDLRCLPGWRRYRHLR